MEKKWFLEDFSGESKYLVVGFGSVRMFHKTKKKGFEWQNLFKYKYNDLDFKKLFVADIRNSWWHTNFGNLPGIGPPTLTKFLLEKIEKSNAEKTLFVGVSMGGYGAILFGCLTKATKVLAFSPQTELTESRRKKQLNRKFEGYKIDETFTDLRNVLETTKNDETVYKIWYGNLNGSDKRAAKRISHFKDVSIYPINSSRHVVIRPVLQRGIFREELEDFLGKK
jgi:hypothetical protein